jgi:hypothetical protein
MFVEPKVMLTGVETWNPVINTITVVPAGPEEGFNVTERVCAFAAGAIIAAKAKMLRKSTIRVALLSFFPLIVKRFCNEIFLPIFIALQGRYKIWYL